MAARTYLFPCVSQHVLQAGHCLNVSRGARSIELDDAKVVFGERVLALHAIGQPKGGTLHIRDHHRLPRVGERSVGVLETVQHGVASLSRPVPRAHLDESLREGGFVEARNLDVVPDDFPEPVQARTPLGAVLADLGETLARSGERYRALHVQDVHPAMRNGEEKDALGSGRYARASTHVFGDEELRAG